MAGIILLCSQIISIIGNRNINIEILNLQRTKEQCVDRDHYIIRKLIVFSILYIATQNLWISIGVPIALLIFNYEIDQYDHNARIQERLKEKAENEFNLCKKSEG